MSILNTYLETEQQLKQLQERLAQLENDEGFKRELEFKSKLEHLLKDYEKSAADAIALLSPETTAKGKTKSSSGTKRKRKLRIYKHPDTKEVVETRSGHHKTLKAWRDEFGTEAVESWLIRVED